ncbi:MAG: hypothetical protein C3F02_04255 [Parcubacteria group bacterium]|nr:MAG: hypothetical protein C3F02_04255 [Parcubacteria group bacterium]
MKLKRSLKIAVVLGGLALYSPYFYYSIKYHYFIATLVIALLLIGVVMVPMWLVKLIIGRGSKKATTSPEYRQSTFSIWVFIAIPVIYAVIAVISMMFSGGFDR